MRTKITGTALRNRLLDRLKNGPAPVDLTEILASRSNRGLLTLIARRKPRSIGELSELAGRAQPNVSRSLNALVWGGLVRLDSDGRRSIPLLTELGTSKVQELDLVTSSVETVEEEEFAFDKLSGARFRLSFDTRASEGDAVGGSLAMKLRFKSCDDLQDLYFTKDDLGAFALRLIENWWRLFYRRGAPYKFADFFFGQPSGETRLSCALQSSGSEIEITSRYLNGMGPRPDRNSVAILSFERQLLEGIIRPVSDKLSQSLRYDRPLQSLLSRLDEARDSIAEMRYCKTVGALGLSPYDTPVHIADCVRDIVTTMPDDDARLDFASAVLSKNLIEAKDWIDYELEQKSQSNRMAGLPDLKKKCGMLVNDAGLRRWKLGIHYAQAARKTLGLTVDKSLGGVAGINRVVGSDQSFALSAQAPGSSLRAFRSWKDEAPEIILRDEQSSTASAFLFSRAIGDYLAFGGKSASVADLYTDRQATNRAFAAEFIAPSEGVVRMMEEEGVPVHQVAAHYGASTETIHRQYDNNAEIYLGA